MSFKDLPTPYQSVEREMRRAMERGEAWYELVRRFDAAFDAAQDHDEQMTVQEASEAATGLSPLMWRRQRAALTKTEEIAHHAGLPLESLLSATFAHQELAVRAFDRSPDEGLKILMSSANGGVRLAEIRQLLTRLPPKDPTGSKAARAAVGDAKRDGTALIDRALKDSSAKLFGKGCAIVRRPRLRLFTTGYGYEVIAKNGTVAAGVDVADVGIRTNQDRLAQTLPSSLLLSSFYPQFFIACRSADGGGTAKRSADTLNWLGASWVGILAVRSDGSVQVVRRPKGRPVPDRTALYEVAKRAFGSIPGPLKSHSFRRAAADALED
jgi:hypothetical protein